MGYTRGVAHPINVAVLLFPDVKTVHIPEMPRTVNVVPKIDTGGER